MFRAPRLYVWLAPLALLFLAIPTQAQQALSSKAEGLYTDDYPVDGGTQILYITHGQGMPTGKFTASGQHIETSDGHLTNGQMTVADLSGNQIFLGYSGTINADGDFVATVTVLGGTGKFQGATGNANLHGQDWGAGMFGAVLDGTISY